MNFDGIVNVFQVNHEEAPPPAAPADLVPLPVSVTDLVKFFESPVVEANEDDAGEDEDAGAVAADDADVVVEDAGVEDEDAGAVAADDADVVVEDAGVEDEDAGAVAADDADVVVEDAIEMKKAYLMLGVVVVVSLCFNGLAKKVTEIVKKFTRINLVLPVNENAKFIKVKDIKIHNLETTKDFYDIIVYMPVDVNGLLHHNIANKTYQV